VTDGACACLAASKGKRQKAKVERQKAKVERQKAKVKSREKIIVDG